MSLENRCFGARSFSGYFILALMGPGVVDSPSLAAASPPAAANRDARLASQGSCELIGRYRATLALEEEFGGTVCPSQRSVVIEFAISQTSQALVATMTKGGQLLGLKQRSKVELTPQREDGCGFELRVISDNDQRDVSDSTILRLSLKRRGDSMAGTGSLDRTITATAGNSTGSRTDQCAMKVIATGRIDPR